MLPKVRAPLTDSMYQYQVLVPTQGINESANFRFLQRLSVIVGFRRDRP